MPRPQSPESVWPATAVSGGSTIVVVPITVWKAPLSHRSAAAHRHAGRSPSTRRALDEPRAGLPPRVPSSRLGRRCQPAGPSSRRPRRMAQSRTSCRSRRCSPHRRRGPKQASPRHGWRRRWRPATPCRRGWRATHPNRRCPAEMVELATATVPDVLAMADPVPSLANVSSLASSDPEFSMLLTAHRPLENVSSAASSPPS